MAIIGFELVTVGSDYVIADMLIWNRYKHPAPGMVELMLDANPHLAKIHRYTPFLPVGTMVRVPIDPEMVQGKLPPTANSNLWTNRSGYRL